MVCDVDEAGPIGFWLCRHLSSKGIPCEVSAPSRIPQKASDRVTADRRGALNPARLFRSGELTLVRVPDEADEAVRDLVRARLINRQMSCPLWFLNTSSRADSKRPLTLQNRRGVWPNQSSQKTKSASLLAKRKSRTPFGDYDKPHPPKGFLELCEHGNSVRFRTIWVRPFGEDDQP